MCNYAIIAVLSQALYNALTSRCHVFFGCRYFSGAQLLAPGAPPVEDMDTEQRDGGKGYPASRPTSGAMGRLIFRVATQIFGGRMNTTGHTEPPDQGQETKPAAATPASLSSKAAQILEHALTQVEALLGNLDEPEAQPVPGPEAATKEAQEMASVELNEVKRALREVVVRLEDALDHLGIEAQRLSDETSRITIVADRLESRLLGLTRALESGAQPHPPEAEPTPAPLPEAPAAHPEPAAAATGGEPRFLPGERGIAVVIAAVPGFQGLMDVQRGLSGLPAVEGASVSRYRDGEASLELVLRAPVTARQLVETLRLATGHGIVVEDEAPGELRLRLRFVDADSARGNGAVAEVAVEPLPQRASPDG